MSLLPKSIERLRQEAKFLSKSEGVSHSAALQLVSQTYGFPNWKAVLNASDEYPVVKRTDSPISKKTESSEAIPEAESTSSTKHIAELADGIKIRIAKNKAYFAASGVEYSIFEPTLTALKKSIIDATRTVRTHFELEKYHYFDLQGQGEENKLIRDGCFVTDRSITFTQVSLYRPQTKQGDPRMWFKKLGTFANPTNQVAIVIFQNVFYLFNFSEIDFESLPESSDSKLLITSYVRAKNNTANELLNRLKEIAKSPIRAMVSGDTAVGMAVEHALNIVANSSKKPDYKGIELKSGRGHKNRTTLFAQVPDWAISQCKSSAEILDKYGYQRGEDFKLYCTISTLRANSQGLKFEYNESDDQLNERDRDNKVVAIWPGQLLRHRLLEKHAETFWIQADVKLIDGVEHFDLISVTHTRCPLESQLLPLIKSGVITMDHLIKRKGGIKTTVSEKGPLFKINKRDLHFLFPEPKTYPLKP